jgi:outer membrane autotransporter protein
MVSLALDRSDVTSGRIKLQDGKTVISPMLGLETTQLEQPRYTETGAGDLGLTVDAQSYQRLRSTIGVRFNTESRIGNTPTYTSVYLAYNRDSGLDNMDVRASYSGTTDAQYTGFTTTAAALARNMFELGAGTTLALSKGSSLQLRYDLQHRLSYNAQGVQAKGVWKF